MTLFEKRLRELGAKSTPILSYEQTLALRNKYLRRTGKLSVVLEEAARIGYELAIAALDKGEG